MSNWLTVHYPHPIDYKLPWDIYLQDKHKIKADDIKTNDLVFFYELLGNGVQEINHVKYKTEVGKKGVVRIGRVKGVPYNRGMEEAQSTNAKGESKNWGIGIPTDAENSEGFVPLDKVNEILGFKKKNIFTGFPGVKELNSYQANKLLALFESSNSFESIQNNFDTQVKLSLSDDADIRQARLQAAPKKPRESKTSITVYSRNPDVVAETLLRANGVCEKCNQAAPFLRAKDNTPYLEVHHIALLSNGGEDTVENTLALCPNCHRKLHYGHNQ